MTEGVSSQVMIVSTSAVADFVALVPGTGSLGACTFWRPYSKHCSSCHLTIPWGGQLTRPSLQGIGGNKRGTCMAIISGSESYCKVTHVENGKMTVRRVHLVMVQAADGRLYQLEKAKLPDSISIYSGEPNQGATAEILLGTKPVPSIGDVYRSFMNGTRARDISFALLGMLILTVLGTVADIIAQLMNG